MLKNSILSSHLILLIFIPCILSSELSYKPLESKSTSHSFLSLKSEKIKINFFLESLSPATGAFIKDFNDIYRNLEEFIEFVPHYTFSVCKECSENGFKESKLECVSNGRYCIENPAYKALNGHALVIQSLEEMCIYQISPKKWWEYQLEVALCNQACFKDIYNKMGNDKTKVDDCVAKSFEGLTSNDNTLLRYERETTKNFAINKFPSLFINKTSIPIEESHDTLTNLKEKICQSLNEKPSYCQTKDNMIKKENKLLFISAFMILLLLGLSLSWHFYKKSKIRKGHDQVGIQLDQIVSQYFALGSEDSKPLRKKTIEVNI